MVEVLRVRFRNGEPASPLRHAARDTLERTLVRCDEDTVDDVLVVISELVQNVSQHTRSDGELSLGVGHHHVLIEVSDGDSRAPHPRRPDAGRIGGRGLMLVAGVAEDWGVRLGESGKVVWARLPTAA